MRGISGKTPSAVMAEVDRVMAVRWQWGLADCCTAASDVFLALWGVDPMAELRGTYEDAGSAARLIARRGGFLALCEAAARSSGLVAGAGRPGDIGLSAAGAGGGPDGRAMLICVKPGAWAGKSDLGYSITRDVERCWCVNLS